MPASQDSFTAPNNATLERDYQLLNAGQPQSLAGWILYSEWRFADGTIALVCSRANGKIIVTDEPNGFYSFLIGPFDLQAMDIADKGGAINFDVIAIPPVIAGTPGRVYQTVSGTATLTIGQTRSGW